MPERSFYEDRAKAETKAAVGAIEAQTSAEVVVSLRWTSDRYREADYLFGFLVSLAALVAMLFVDWEFRLESFPIGAALAFALGALVSSRLSPIRRVLVTSARKAQAVRTAARAAFVDLGVARTTRRAGILVYVSMLERRVELVTDVGVQAAHPGPSFTAAAAALGRSLEPSPDLDRFLTALRALGPALAHCLPHHEGDANELPDDVEAG